MLRNVVLIFIFLLTSFKGQTIEIDNIEFDVNKLNDHVYIFAQPYGETLINFGAVVGSDGVVLITSMMQEHASTIEKLIESVTDRKVQYVINIDSDTYQHNANKYFSSKGAIIVAQEEVKKINNFIDIGYEDRVSIDVGSELIEVVHTSARNPGDSAVFLKSSNVIFLGDTFRNDWISHSKTSGYKTHLKALEFILALGNEGTKFVPGNRKSVVYNNVQGVEKAKNIHFKFANKVKELSIVGLSVDEIAKNQEIHNILNGLERYNQFKKYIKTYVQNVIDAI